MTQPSYAKPLRGLPDQAVAYLFGLPFNSITLTAIIPDGGGPTLTATFAKSADGSVKAAKWISDQQAARKNIYFQDCSVDSINKRPTKADVCLIHCAHADLDVQGTLSPEAHATAIKAILAVLEGYKIEPTDIICTGNGIQAFWYLRSPLAGSPENIRKIEAANLALREELGGDNCQDVAHLMRVPFTINYPSKLKVSKGRLPVRSYVIRENHADDFCLVPLEKLPAAPLEVKSNNPPDKVLDDLNIPDTVDLSRLSDSDRATIKNGTTATNRSDAVYALACVMRRAKYSDAEIIATITSPANRISDHILEQTQRNALDGPNPTGTAQALRIIIRMDKLGVKLPDFADDPPEPLTAVEEKQQSKLRDRMAKEKQAKQEKIANRRERVVKGLRVVQGGDIPIENLRFLWQYVLARGIHTVFAGEGGQGKSQVAYNVAAAPMTGGKLPDGTKVEPGNVVFLNAEDTTNSMFGPRLRAAVIQALGKNATEQPIEAAMNRAIKVQSTVSSEGDQKFSLQNDLEKLKELCEEIGNVVLIIVDPASSYMGGALDGRQNSQIRAVLDPISKLAEDLDCAVLSINHFNKGVSAKAINRVIDSVANVNAPRAVWGMFPDPDDIEGADGAPHLFVQVKTNIAPKNLPGWSYKMTMKLAGKDARDGTPVMASCIVWTGKTEISADEIVALEIEKAKAGAPRTEEAMEFLRKAIEDKDPSPFVGEVKQAAEAEGIMPTTLMKAKRKLGVKALPPDEMGGEWRWSLPKAPAPELDFDDDYGTQPD